MASLLLLRECNFGADLALKLVPFIRAYAPFQELRAPIKLRDIDYEKVKEMSFLEECWEVNIKL